MIESNPLTIKPRAWLELYQTQKYAQLSEEFIQFLDHFERTTYITIAPDLQYKINVFLKNFLYLLTQPDYLLSEHHIVRFIQLNPTIANLTAISDFKTTDTFLKILINQPKNLAKILILYSPRNTLLFDYQAFFEANSQLTNLWYSYFCEAYRYGMASQKVYQNLQKHLEIDCTQLTNFYQLPNLYFGSTYINGDRDREIKQKINQTIQNSQFCRTARVQNTPNFKKIAIITAYWTPGHSAYRTFAGFVQSLKDDYHLTLIHLGSPNPDLAIDDFEDVKSVNVINGTLNLDSIRDNDFALVYYPDVGMNQESIMLANLRLAPIQVCSLGHSVSTFGSQIDYFISGADVEIPESATVNYSEKLVLLPGYGASHQKPTYQPRNVQKNRPELIINCPWYAHKINYPLIISLQKILNNARVEVLFRFYPGHALSEKNGTIPFLKDLGELLERKNFEVILNQPYETYMEIMEEGDICLDSYPFAGCNIIVDSLYLRKPTITLEGKKWYNRIGSQMLREVGLTELIATHVEQYISLTLKLIHDDAYRDSIGEKLKKIDLDEIIFRKESQPYFKRAIDFLMQERGGLKEVKSSTPSA